MLVRRTVAALCAAAVSLFSAVLPVRADAPAAGPVAPARVATLANGLRVVVLEDHAAPVAVMNVWYRFGGAYETRGKTGLAHALEHMMFRGTTSVSSAGLDDWGAQLGASVNAQTTEEFTRFDFVLPADRVDAALHLEADRMRNLKLDPADWQRERGAVLQEWTQDYSSAFFTFGNELQRKIYRDSPLARTALGEKADIERATVADLRRYYDTWYQPNNATVVITGDVDPAAVIASAKRWFGPIPARPVPTVRIASPTAATGVTVRSHAEFPFTVVDLAYAAPPSTGATELESIRALIALLALQNPRGPFRAALVDSGITLGFAIVPALDRHIATYNALLIVAPGHTAGEARAAYEATLAAVLSKGLDPEYVAAAKRAALTSLVYTRDSVSGLAGVLGASYVFPGDRDPLTYNALIDAITPAQVNAAAKHVFAAPNGVGVMDPSAGDPAKAKPPGDLSGTIKDDFGGRVPDGAVVQPPWMRADLARPLALHSRVAPVITTLPNGLRLLVQRVRDNPTVYIEGTLARSVQFDPAGKDGLGAIVSALMAYGSEHYDYGAQRKLGDDLAAQLGFGASFSAHGLARDFEPLLAALADDVRRPLLPADRFALIKTQTAAAVSRNAVDPSHRASRAFLEALYPSGDPALREPTTASLDAITLADVQAYAAKYDRPDLTTLVVVGDVDPAAVAAGVARAFGDWSATGPKPDAHLAPVPAPAAARTFIRTGALDVSVRLGQNAPAQTDPDADAFTIADALLDDQSFASRLFREVREKRGLVYSIGTTYASGRDRGTWSSSFRAVPSKVDAADALVRAEMRRLQTEPVGIDELRRCETRQAARTVIEEQATAALAGELMTIGTEELPADYYATLAARYAKVTPADVQRAAKTWFHPDALVEVRTGSNP